MKKLIDSEKPECYKRGEAATTSWASLLTTYDIWGGTMNQGDLIEKVAKRASISKAQAERALNAVKEAITDSLRKNDRVTLVGFGTFSLSHRKARRGHNPYTAERIKIPATRGIRFSAGKQLKEAVNKRRK
jgi:DNA-binding protein HU-beta